MTFVTRRNVLGVAAAGGASLLAGKGFAAAPAGEPTAPVDTSYGKVRGLRADGVRAFKGIPFAGSTSGKRRFLPAPPPTKWSGVRDAFEYGPASPQVGLYRDALGAQPNLIAEDGCLTVNVWTPAEPGERLPVLFNLHGGGFTVGSGRLDATCALTPELVRQQRFVLVTANYRLGVLGILPLAEIAGPEYRGSGNLCIADQIMALRWVRDNIARFGGDPRQVTISGQSAGGVSVGHLMGAPTAAGLFHRAVDEYGPISSGNTPEAGAEIARRFFAKLDLAPADWRKLLDMPADQLIKAQGAVGEMMGIIWGDKLWVPINDGHLLARNSLEALANPASKVPLIAGCDWDHMALVARMLPQQAMPPSQEAEVMTRLRRNLGPEVDRVIAYFKSKRPDASLVQHLVTIQGELFRGGLIHMAEARERAGAASWVYLQTSGSNMNMPRERLAAFAVTGKPDAPGEVPWPQHRSNDRATLVVDKAGQRIERDPYGDDRKAVTAIHFGA